MLLGWLKTALYPCNAALCSFAVTIITPSLPRRQHSPLAADVLHSPPFSRLSRLSSSSSPPISHNLLAFRLSLVRTESSHITPSRPKPEFPDNRKVLRATEKEKSPAWFISCRKMMRESDAFSGNLRGNKKSQPGDSPNLFPLTFGFFFFLIINDALQKQNKMTKWDFDWGEKTEQGKSRNPLLFLIYFLNTM